MTGPTTTTTPRKQATVTPTRRTATGMTLQSAVELAHVSLTAVHQHAYEVTPLPPLDALRHAHNLQVLAGDAIELLAARAQESGASWADVGAVLGVSRQAAHARYATKEQTR